MNLLECYMPVFILITSLRSEPEKYSDYETTRECILDEIEKALRETEKISISDSESDSAFYAIIVMVDEVILCSELPFKKLWRDNLLQIKFFGHSTGGVEFFNILNRIIGTKNKAGYIFLFCLLLGFRGKYSVSSKNEIFSYINKLRSQYELDAENSCVEENRYDKKNKPFNVFLLVTSVIVIYLILSVLIYIK
ncbi:TPA: DotU family type IV/VI secretion system protein [Yersinia enterocolitica]|nr:DotU family type IV/VI secretion system protein [Yersinia enterocolitica]HDL7830226.1 DotU family type IV/VI secretion system protein [Yersinia enterocolitica]HDL7871082.1 DotU family type IV/VI secretion system protein [Yersinia enterocolitica]HDL7884766.1 DotU family type IV/VI secretion system protein [Yersinia enterocolitica]HDL7892258.1 DotU family type IV/VI secretion system protein [Yersinia enterocolitica]